MGWRPRLLVHALFLVSGATGLVYQVSWVRDLSLIFGASHQAVSIVLASFMAGLSLGGLYFGRRVFQKLDALRLYGMLEIGVAACALLLPLAYWLIDLVYVSFALRIEGVNWMVTALRVLMAFAALLAPTFFMGGTLPVLTRFLVERYGQFGVRVASLYAINTIGAVAGVALGTFLLLPGLGVWRTQVLAAAVNVAIGLVAFAIQRQMSSATGRQPAPEHRRHRDRRRHHAAATPAPQPPPAARPAAAEPPPRRVLALRLAFWGTAVSGLAALGLEVMWSRGISISSGTTIYSFAVMLIAFLTGIAIGSALHAIFPLRRIHEGLQFAVAFIGAGLSSIVASQWIPRLPDLAVRWNTHLYQTGLAVGTKTTLLMAFSIMLVPCIFMGLAFPLSSQANSRLVRSFGRSIGDTIAVNTGAAIAGSLLAGFVLIPGLGLQRGMLLLSTLYAAYGVIVLAATFDFRRRSLLWGARAAALVVLVLVCTIPARLAPWDLQTLGTFRNHSIRSYVDPQGRSVLRQQLEQANLLYYEEGRGSTISVFEFQDRRSLVVNGKSVAGDVMTDLHHEMLLGHLPVLLHPNPKTAIVVGLGAGVTLGAVAAHDGLERIDLVEIEPAVYGAADLFADIHGDALRDPRVHAFDQDGRNFLLTTRATYDVITADPIHPWAQGAAYLFTAEYYRMLAQRLEPGGIMCQWFPLYDFSDANLRSVTRTFVESFPYVTLWQTVFDAILIGSNAPIALDPADLARRMQQPRVARQLSRIGIDTPLALLTEFAMDDATLRAFSARGIVNTDDNLYIEFSSPLALVRYNWLDNLRLVRAQRSSPLAVVRNRTALGLDAASLQQTLDAYARAKTELVAAAVAIHNGAPEDVEAAGERLREIARALPEYGLPRRYGAHAWGQVAGLRWRAGRADQAIAAAAAAVELCPDDGEGHHMLGLALSTEGRVEEAAEELAESLRWRPRHVGTRTLLETTLVQLGQDAEVVRLLREGQAMFPQNSELATRLAWRLSTLPDPGARDGAQALRLAQAALELPIPRGRRANTLLALAAAQAETGQFDAATDTARSALELAERAGQNVTVQLLRDCTAAFAERRPFRHGWAPKPGTSAAPDPPSAPRP